MVKFHSLEDLVNDCIKINDIDVLKSQMLTIISSLQKELKRTRHDVEDFRNLHGFKDGSVDLNDYASQILVDPVINAEVLHLRKLLHDTSDKLKKAEAELEAHQFDPNR